MIEEVDCLACGEQVGSRGESGKGKYHYVGIIDREAKWKSAAAPRDNS
jgi:hypothetical protein